jgi:hypothetical protein
MSSKRDHVTMTKEELQAENERLSQRLSELELLPLVAKTGVRSEATDDALNRIRTRGQKE